MIVSGAGAAGQAGRDGTGRGAGRGPALAGRVGAARRGRAGARSALRSTAPRVKIDGVVRGSLMVT